MFYQPMTKDEARKYRYNIWAGNPKGNAYVETCCAAECYEKTSRMFYQCTFRNGKGPDGLYCGIHAKKVRT